MAQLRVRSHRLDKILADGAESWWSVYHRDPQATPFQRPNWIEPWWRCFADQYEAGTVLSVHGSGNEVVAVLPLVLDADGTAIAAPQHLSDYSGWVLSPSVSAAEAAAALLSALRSDGVTRLKLPDLAYDSSLAAALAACPGMDRSSGEVCPQIAVAGSWDEYWCDRSGNLRSSVSRAFRRSDRDTHTVFEPDPDERQLRSFVTLHLRWWRERDRSSLLEYPRIAAFLTEIGPAMRGSGVLVLSSARSRSRTEASFLLIEERGTRYYYQSTIEPDAAESQPGLRHLTEVVQHTFGAGFSCLDLLRGAERYKVQFSTEVRTNIDVSVELQL